MKLSSLVFGTLALLFVNGASAQNPFAPMVHAAYSYGAREAQVSIAPPPAPGSATDIADFKELHYWQNNRTQVQCDAAAKEAGLLTLWTFIGSHKDLLNDSQLNNFRIVAAVSMVQLKVAAVTMGLKKNFNRPRPYTVDKSLKPCIPLEASSAYPSGHASSAYAIATVLSTMFPDKEAAFMDRAQEISFNRLLGGVHHRTDLIAGEKIGRFYGRGEH